VFKSQLVETTFKYLQRLKLGCILTRYSIMVMRIEILLFFLFFLGFGKADAQTAEDKAKAALGADYEQVKQANADSLAWLEYWVENGQAIMTDVPAYKLKNLQLLSELTYVDGSKPFKKIQDTDAFNRLLFPNPQDNRFAALYRIDGTSSVFVIRPFTEVKIEFEENYGK
jgi:hypothetical protein